MGSIGTIFAALLVAVNYGWVPASADSSADSQKASAAEATGYEYLVQIGPEDLRALAEGRIASLSSATPAGMKSIDQVRIVFGKGELPRQLTAVDRTSPQRIAAQSQEARRHTVSKPIVSDWLPARNERDDQSEGGPSGGERHTVYQQPGYTNPGSLGEAMQRGFQEGSRQLTDAVRNAPQNLSNFGNQAARDLAQGTQGVVGGALGGARDSIRAGANGMGNVAKDTMNMGNPQYFNQRQREQNGAVPQNGAATTPSGFRPYSYNEARTEARSQNSPFTAPTNGHDDHDHAGQGHSGQGQSGQGGRSGQGHAGQNHSEGTGFNTQRLDNHGNRGPAFPRSRGGSEPGHSPNDSGIATTFGSGAADNRGYENRDYDNRRSYSAPYDDRRLTPVARTGQESRSSQNDSFYDRGPSRLGPIDEFSRRREEPRRGGYNNWGSQATDDRPAAPAFNTPSSWDTPPTQPPLTRTSGFATPPQNQQAASPEVQSWGDGAATPPPQNHGTYAPQANNAGPQNASFGNSGNNLLFLLLLAGSLAGNLYVVTSYLDVRNKYRSALRRGPGGYQNGA